MSRFPPPWCFRAPVGHVHVTAPGSPPGAHRWSRRVRMVTLAYTCATGGAGNIRGRASGRRARHQYQGGRGAGWWGGWRGGGAGPGGWGRREGTAGRWCFGTLVAFARARQVCFLLSRSRSRSRSRPRPRSRLIARAAFFGHSLSLSRTRAGAASTGLRVSVSPCLVFCRTHLSQSWAAATTRRRQA